MDSSPDDKPLLTISEVLARCANAGRPLAASTFRTYVAKDKAPRPAGKRGNQPLWRESEISSWLKNYAEVKDDVQVVSAPSKVRLHSEHGIVLDPDLSEHEAMKQAERELQARVIALESTLALRSSRIEDMENRKEHTLAESHVDANFISRLIKNFDAQRRARSLQNWLELRQSEYQEIQQTLLAARHDLRIVKKWNDELLSWAKYQENEREQQARQLAYAQEQASTALPLEKSLSLADFILANPHRLSYATKGTAGELENSEVLDQLRNHGTYRGKLVLRGADFGFRYRLDATDRGEYMENGEWRVSWIGNARADGELYAELFDRTLEPRVFFFGALPETSLQKMIDWLFPFECQQGERNSLGLIARAYEEQKDAGFPALTLPKRNHAENFPEE